MALIWNDQYVNIVLDGNSNIAGSALEIVTERYGLRLMAALGGGVTGKNLAKGGDTWKWMLDGTNGSGIQEVHAAFEPGKQNILIIGEDFNAAVTEKSVAVVLAQRQAYIDAVKAVHPEWRILGMTMPAGKDEAGDGYNEIVDECNTYLRANWASMGLEGFIETRPPGGPFDYSPPYGYSPSRFENSPYYRDAVHWNVTGVDVIVGYTVARLNAMPDVAPAAGQSNPNASGLKRGRGSAMIGRF